MRLQRLRAVGVAGQIGPVGEPIAKQHMHHRAGQCPIGARAEHEAHVGLLDSGGLVDIDGHDPSAALLAGPHRVRHHIDLRGDRVGAPDDDAVGLRHLARVGTGQTPGAGNKARPGEVDADRRVEARIALGMGEALDAVAHHQTHRAGIVVGPDAFRAKVPFGREELVCDPIERLVPPDAGELAGALRPGAHQRMGQPVGMVDAFGVARDLGADHARRVGLARRTVDPSDAAAVDHLNLKGAGRRAVVRTDAVAAQDGGGSVHRRSP